MTYDCMTDEELALWRDTQVARARVKFPCGDCPAWFEAQARSEGCCRRPSTPERREAMARRHRERVQ